VSIIAFGVLSIFNITTQSLLILFRSKRIKAPASNTSNFKFHLRNYHQEELKKMGYSTKLERKSSTISKAAKDSNQQTLKESLYPQLVFFFF
jgi:hypothetical protein